MDDPYDDDIAALMRRAEPAVTQSDRRSAEEVIADLQRITGRPAGRPSAPARRWPWLVVPSVAAAVAIVAVLVQVWNPLGTGDHPAAAATPPLLALSDSSLSLGGVMDRARQQLALSAASEPERHASFEGWYLQTEVGPNGSHSVITPQEQEFEWKPDLSGSMTVVAGASYAPDRGGALPEGKAPAEGQVLRHEEYGAGEIGVLFQTPPPTDPAEMRDYLATATGLDPDSTDAYDYLSAIRVLLSEWTLGPAQHAALLDVIQSTTDVTVAGNVTDRLGRPGVALRATSAAVPQFEYLAVISRETGAVIALETVYLGGVPELDVTPPCVIDYIAWK